MLRGRCWLIVCLVERRRNTVLQVGRRVVVLSQHYWWFGMDTKDGSCRASHHGRLVLGWLRLLQLRGVNGGRQRPNPPNRGSMQRECVLLVLGKLTVCCWRQNLVQQEQYVLRRYDHNRICHQAAKLAYLARDHHSIVFRSKGSWPLERAQGSRPVVLKDKKREMNTTWSKWHC